MVTMAAVRAVIVRIARFGRYRAVMTNAMGMVIRMSGQCHGGMMRIHGHHGRPSILERHNEHEDEEDQTTHAVDCKGDFLSVANPVIQRGVRLNEGTLSA